MITSIYTAFAFLAAVSTVTAQTFTNCDPTTKTCPDDPALGMEYNFNFTQQSNASTWQPYAGTVNYGANGAEFTINKKGDSPTIKSSFYIFFGTVEIHMKAATGQGVISSIVLESDDLDEVDWEFIGGNHTTVETNYFGKGNQTVFDRAIYYPVTEPMDTYHNYTVHWTSEKLEWYIDTVLVRTLMYHDANGGHNFPQTPMYVQIGIWAGGDPGNGNGTIEWAGGLTDFSQAPFTMYVQSARITDASTGKAYHWSDMTGSFESIQVVGGNSTAKEILTKVPDPPAPSLAEKWAAIPAAGKIGVYAGAGGVGALFLGLLTFCCIRQKRAGRRERDMYIAKLDADRKENEAYKMEPKLRSVDSLSSSATATEFGTGEFARSASGHFSPKRVPTPLSPTSLHGYANGGLPSPRGFSPAPPYQSGTFNNNNNSGYAGVNDGFVHEQYSNGPISPLNGPSNASHYSLTQPRHGSPFQHDNQGSYGRF